MIERQRTSLRLGGCLPRTLSRMVVLVGLIPVALSATLVHAQHTGTLIGHDATKKDATVALHMIAECYYDRNPRNVRTWLLLLPGDVQEAKLIDRDSLDLSACLDSNRIVFDEKEVVFKTPVLRESVGVVAARRLLAKLGDQASPPNDRRPWFYERVMLLPANAPIDRVSLSLQEFGTCVALAGWKSSLALIRSDNNSTEEQTAVSGLVPVLGPCVAKGSTIKITKQDLRGMLGEPVYHLLLAAVPQYEAR